MAKSHGGPDVVCEGVYKGKPCLRRLVIAGNLPCPRCGSNEEFDPKRLEQRCSHCKRLLHRSGNLKCPRCKYITVGGKRMGTVTEAMNIRAGRLLLSKGYQLGRSTVYVLEPWEDWPTDIGILKPTGRTRRIGLFRKVPDLLYAGRILMSQDAWKNKNGNWTLEVSGRAHMQEMSVLAAEMEREFGKPVNVELVREEAERAVYFGEIGGF